jgi:hypothetical protein
LSAELKHGITQTKEARRQGFAACARLFLQLQAAYTSGKKQVIAARNLKYWTKFTTQNKEKQKRKSSFLIATILCFPEH